MMQKKEANDMAKRLIVFVLGIALLFSALTGFTVSAESVSDKVLSIADGIIDWKKKDVGSETDGNLINSAFLELAGSTAGDWYPIGLGRLGIADNYSGYLAVIKDKIEERYRQSGKLSSAKATEWHRIALSVLAMGGDPKKIGTDENGQPIDLIADGTYDRGKTTSLGRQGINGWIWGLIALDSKRYEIPENAFNSRKDIITEIMCRQLSDGGFALSGNKSDADITAMAVQALAPYYNSEESYSYTQKALKAEVSKTVREVIDEALECLSQMQLESGDFASWGTQNVESTDQVVTALCCLGIDPLNDSRFIKNGNTLLDGILRYQMNDGGFTHSFTYDPENPTSMPNVSNSMAGEQTLYTMAALWRQENGMRTLYDFRAEQSEELKQRINSLERKISELNENTSAETLQSLAEEYYSIPERERSYVNGFWQLYSAAELKGVDLKKTAENTKEIESEANDNDSSALEFTDSDKKAVEELPEKLTTEQYVVVTVLLDKLESSNDFEGKDEYLRKLSAAKAEISSVQAEIDSLNADILSGLYPFESITLADKKTVDDIFRRCEALSEYDRAKIERREDVVKTKTKIDNELRGIIIAIILFIFASVAAFFLVIRIRKRRRRKALEMEELAEKYSDE